MLFDWLDKYEIKAAFFLFFVCLNFCFFCIIGTWFYKALQKGDINGDAAENVNSIHTIGIFRMWAVMFALLALIDVFYMIFQLK